MIEGADGILDARLGERDGALGRRPDLYFDLMNDQSLNPIVEGIIRNAGKQQPTTTAKILRRETTRTTNSVSTAPGALPERTQ
jgi:hypothetical protein